MGKEYEQIFYRKANTTKGLSLTYKNMFTFAHKKTAS